MQRKTSNEQKAQTPFEISEDNEIHLIIKNLNVGKAFGWNNSSIRMIKICNKSLSLPLKLIFNLRLHEGMFPEDGKQSNAIPIQKKMTRQI